jgi:hypothetical protein
MDVLVVFGFSAQRVDLSPEGGVTLHADQPAPKEADALAEWESSRASRTH